jgi:hypothetical protein
MSLQTVRRWIEKNRSLLPKPRVKGWHPDHAVRLADSFFDAHAALMDRTEGNNEVALQGAHLWTVEYESELKAGHDDRPRLAPFTSDVCPMGPDDDHDDDETEPDPRAAGEIERLLVAVGYDPAAPFTPYSDGGTFHGKGTTASTL